MKKLELSQQEKQQKKNVENIVVNFVKDDTFDDLQKNYSFSGGEKNPYAGRIKKQITIRITSSTIDYFKDLGQELDMPYQSLMNMCLTDYAKNKRVPTISL